MTACNSRCASTSFPDSNKQTANSHRASVSPGWVDNNFLNKSRAAACLPVRSKADADCRSFAVPGDEAGFTGTDRSNEHPERSLDYPRSQILVILHVWDAGLLGADVLRIQ